MNGFVCRYNKLKTNKSERGRVTQLNDGDSGPPTNLFVIAGAGSFSKFYTWQYSS